MRAYKRCFLTSANEVASNYFPFSDIRGAKQGASQFKIQLLRRRHRNTCLNIYKTHPLTGRILVNVAGRTKQFLFDLAWGRRTWVNYGKLKDFADDFPRIAERRMRKRLAILPTSRVTSEKSYRGETDRALPSPPSTPFLNSLPLCIPSDVTELRPLLAQWGAANETEGLARPMGARNEVPPPSIHASKWQRGRGGRPNFIRKSEVGNRGSSSSTIHPQSSRRKGGKKSRERGGRK